MAAKPKRTPDHINFIMVSIFLIALSQILEIYPTLLTQFLRTICISLVLFSGSWALYLYDRARKV